MIWSEHEPRGIRLLRVQIGGMTFDVAEAGSGDHLALCLHGFPELNYAWRYQMLLLARMGYRVWAPNQRGYGGSSRPDSVQDYTVDKLVADVAALFDASKAARLTLIGHDWGGFVAWIFAINRVRPVERLVVMNNPHPACLCEALRRWPQRRRSWYIVAMQVPWLPEWWLCRRDGVAIRRLFRGMAVDKSRFSDALLDIYAAAACERGAVRAMVNWYRAAVRWTNWMRFPNDCRVDVPVLIIWGERDTALGLETLNGTERFVSDLTVRRLANVSHWVQQEAPEIVNDILSMWLPVVDVQVPKLST